MLWQDKWRLIYREIHFDFDEIDDCDFDSDDSVNFNREPVERTGFSNVGVMGWDDGMLMPGIRIGKYTTPAYPPTDEEFPQFPVHDACPKLLRVFLERGYHWEV